MAYNFPVIIYRIESHLIALDACRMLDLSVLPELALEAVTKDSDNTDDHGKEQINFQEGMGNNYERLEFLGDCFLKLATTISIFTLTKDKDEFECHVERMLLVCNQNLFNHALDARLEQFIRTRKFDRGTWYPEGLNQIKGKKHKVYDRHTLGDKSIADVCEALIGAAYLTARQQGNLDLAVKAVTTMVKHKNHIMNRWDDYFSLYTVPDWQTVAARQLQLAMVETITRKTGYVFTYPRLLRCAFMHPSYPRSYEHLPSYQRLEFLGDALLDMACVDYLFKQFPSTDPQWLTEHKMPMVSNQFLGCVCAELGFHKHMVAMDTRLMGQVQEYVQSISALRETAIQAAEEAGKRAGCYDRSYWMDGPDPPKCLPDIVEAYIGAMFVDSRYNYSLVEEFFDRHVLPYFADMTPYDSYANRHPITALLHMLDNDMGCSQHRVLDKGVPVDPAESLSGAAAMSETRVVTALMIHGKVAVCGAAASSRYARVAMAKKAGKILEGMARDRYREEYGCDCHLKVREP
jgi:endoribonuclease Dicer